MPKVFEDDQIEELLEELSGGKPLTRICKEKRMPSVSSVYAWVERDEEFSGRFHAARARGVHALAEECLEIADEKTKDAVEVANKRVRIDTRLRLAGKWLSSEYGDKVDVKHSGNVTQTHDLSGYSTSDLEALERLIEKNTVTDKPEGGVGEEKPSSVH